MEKKKLFFRIISMVTLCFIILSIGYKYRHKVRAVIQKVVTLTNKQDIEDQNNILVELSPDINADEITIKWYGRSSKKPVTFNSHDNWGRVPLSEGSNSFSVFYKDSFIHTVGYFKISETKYPDYLFRFYKDLNRVCFDFKVLGIDSLSIKKWDELYHWTKFASGSNELISDLALLPIHDTITNSIEFNFDSIVLNDLINKSEDTKIKYTYCNVNSETLKAKLVKTRGQTSMNYKRKSFNVTLKDPIKLKDANNNTKKLKSFSLLSLSMDHYYFKNRIALELLNKVLGTNIFYSYAEVIINAQSQGVYLLVENPKNYLRDSKKTRFMVRRRYECSSYGERNDIDDAEIDCHFDKSLSLSEVNGLIDGYRELYRILHHKKGQELYDALNARMDLSEYMRIMAFNFMICNADYTDEQFFYTGDLNYTNRFHIFPWDFDDIFSNSPHEGWRLRNSQIQSSTLIFSVENDLDLAIAKDPYLYQQYLKELEEVINILDTIDLKMLFQHTYQELYPFYLHTDIIKPSVFDRYKTVYKLTDFENQLKGVYTFLTKRKDAIRAQIALEKTRLMN